MNHQERVINRSPVRWSCRSDDPELLLIYTNAGKIETHVARDAGFIMLKLLGIIIKTFY